MEFNVDKSENFKNNNIKELAMGVIAGSTGFLSFFVLKVLMKVPMKSSILSSVYLSILLYSSHQVYKIINSEKTNFTKTLKPIWLFISTNSLLNLINEYIIIYYGFKMQQNYNIKKLLLNDFKLKLEKKYSSLIDEYDYTDNESLKELIRNNVDIINYRDYEIDNAVDGSFVTQIKRNIMVKELNLNNIKRNIVNMWHDRPHYIYTFLGSTVLSFTEMLLIDSIN